MSRTVWRAPLVFAGLVLAAWPALSDTRIEKNLKLAPGGEFRLDTDLGRVTVTGSADSGAHVVITSKRKDLDDLLHFRFDEGASLVTITARRKHAFHWFTSSGDSVQYEIQVPARRGSRSRPPAAASRSRG